jgi:hypothetical protein
MLIFLFEHDLSENRYPLFLISSRTHPSRENVNKSKGPDKSPGLWQLLDF